MFFDPMYFLFMLPAMALALWAQAKVKGAYAKYSQVGNSSGFSGAEAAAHMLQGQGFTVVSNEAQTTGAKNIVAIVPTQGVLTDHYDPRTKTLRLSPDVYSGRSLAAVGVACHEAGHALQDAHNYAPLALRTALVPVASFGNTLSLFLIPAGFLLGLIGLIWVGVIGYSLITLFQLVTLPTEFNASNRAKAALEAEGIIRGGEEARGVSKVLNAAALTYIAAAVASILTVLYYVYVITQDRR